MRLTDDEVRRLLDEATPGPWKSDGKIMWWLSGTAPAVCVRLENDGTPICMVWPDGSTQNGSSPVDASTRPVEDARLIAAARDGLADLLDARKRIAKLEAVADAARFYAKHAPECPGGRGATCTCNKRHIVRALATLTEDR